MPTKVVIDCSTGKETVSELTEEEITFICEVVKG